MYHAQLDQVHLHVVFGFLALFVGNFDNIEYIFEIFCTIYNTSVL